MQTSRGLARSGGSLPAGALLPQATRQWPHVLQVHGLHRKCYKYGENLRPPPWGGSTSVSDSLKASEGAGGDQETRGNTRPLSEYVLFETEGGLALLYEPNPLDWWIDRKITMTGVPVSTLTARRGDELTEEDTKDYKRYIQKHNERRDTARR